MPNTQPITVGRIVHYQGVLPKAAIITGLHQLEGGSPDLQHVALHVFEINGQWSAERVPFDADGATGTWRWPPRV